MTIIINNKRKREWEEDISFFEHELHAYYSAWKAKKPKLSKYLRLNVSERSRVLGVVNGRSCTVHLDSGASHSFIFYSQAKALGLLTGNEKVVPTSVSQWEKKRVLELIQLRDVSVFLEGGVEVITDVNVLPQSIEGEYLDNSLLILDVNLFRRGGLVQTFSTRNGTKSSSLYIRKPKRLRKNIRERQQMHEVLTFSLQDRTLESPLTCLVDTGTEVFHISTKYLQTLKGTESDDTKVPHKVFIDLHDGRCVECDKVEVVKDEDVDFIMGRHLLYKYDAILDYSNELITFHVDGERLQLILRPRRVQ